MCFTLFKKRLASDKVWLLLLNFGEIAGVAQLVEHFLAKEDVARSSRVTRSICVTQFWSTDFQGLLGSPETLGRRAVSASGGVYDKVFRSFVYHR